MQAELPQVSFSKGEISPLAASRTDAAFYQNALGICSNFFVRAEGGVSNRPGLEFVGNSLSNTPNGSVLVPFIYNNVQSYLAEFAAGAMQFYSQGAFVQNASTSVVITGVVLLPQIHGPAILQVTAANTFSAGQQVTISGVVYTGTLNPNQLWTIKSASVSAILIQAPAQNGLTVNYISGGLASIPYNLTNNYALADLPNLRWAQSADTLTMTVATQPVYQLKRVTVNDFTFMEPTLLNGPFQDVNTDSTTYMYVSGVQGTVTVFCSSPIFLPTHVGALISIQEQYLDAISPWGAEQFLEQGATSPIGLYTRSDSKIYQCVNSTATSTGTITGTFQPVHTSGTQADGTGQNVPNLAGCEGVSWQFISSGTGCALITGYIDAHHVTAVVQSDEGVWSNFPPTVVGPPVTVFGPFPYTGDGTTKTFTGLTGINTGDPNQFFVTVAGVFQDPSTFTVSQSGTSITFYTAPANAAAVSVTQVRGHGTGNSLIVGLPVSTYWAFGSLSQVQGYPSVVVYFNDRQVLAGTQLQPQTFFTSQVSNYLDFGVSVPQLASDGIVATINARRENPIVDLMPLNDLLVGTASTIWRVTHSASVGAITPSDIALLPQNFYGQQPVPSVQTGDTIIYVQWGGRKIRDLVYQFQYDKYVGTELTIFARQMFPFGTTAVRKAYAPEPFGLLYVVRSDGVLCVCTYLPEQQVTAWATWVTAGFFEDVCVLPENGSFSTYVLVRRVVNGATVRYIERFAPREYSDIDDAFFVDSGLTYDGRNTSTTTMIVTGGTTWMAQDTGTVTASSPNFWAGFSASDPGYANNIWLYDPAGVRTRLKITGFVSATQAAVTFLDPVPTDLQATATATWTFAKTNFTGLTNLVAATVAIFADGATQPNQTVDSTGSFVLPTAGGVVHAGLPYTQQLQGLNLNMQGAPEIRNKAKTPTHVSAVVDESLPFQAGPSFTQLFQASQRDFEEYGFGLTPKTGVVHVPIVTEISDDATICIQNTNPSPLTILSWVVGVDVGESPT